MTQAPDPPEHREPETNLWSPPSPPPPAPEPPISGVPISSPTAEYPTAYQPYQSSYPVPYPPAPASYPPEYQQPFYEQPPYRQAQPGTVMFVNPPNSGIAVTSMVLGIVGLVFGWCLCLIPNLLAIILGHMGLAQTKRGTVSGRGMAVAGLVLGYVSLVPALIFFVLFGLGLIGSLFSAGTATSAGS